MPSNEKNEAKVRNEVIADKVADRVEKIIGKTRPVQKIRNSVILSAMIGAAGLALFLVGVEKVFVALPGWISIAVGLVLLIISGTLLKKLG